MRLNKWSLILVALMCSTIFAQGTVVKPNSDNVGVYQNETREVYEKPIFSVGRSDELTVIETKQRHQKIRTAAGQEGWVETRLVSAVAAGGGGRRGGGDKSRTFVFDRADVIGYLDNPAPVFIMDTDDPGSDPITLDRSFKEALKVNVDKETVQRISR